MLTPFRCLCLLAASCALPALAQPEKPRTLSASERQLNVDSFEYVWKTIRDKHWEAKPGGLDWQAIHDEFRPKMDTADTMGKARAVMSDMLGRLHQTHFGIIPAEVYRDVQVAAQGDGTIGVDVRVMADQALVTSVDAGSPAAEAGVRTGWQIARIDGKELGPTLQKAAEAFGKAGMKDLMLARMVLSRLQGEVGSKIPVEFLDGDDKPVRLELTRHEPRGTMSQFGYLPPMPVWIDTKKLPGNVEYISFNLFLDPVHVMSRFQDGIESCLTCDGVVIDLRGNPGGIGVMAMGMAGWFIDKSGQQLGTMFMRETKINFVVNPRPKTFSGPVAILVDGSSASTSEIFAGGMKDLGRARIFGTRTAAAALPSAIEKLPNGDGFQYAQANYISQGGKPLEGVGVIPDQEVPLTRKVLLAGHDSALDAALQWIEANKRRSP